SVAVGHAREMAPDGHLGLRLPLNAVGAVLRSLAPVGAALFLSSHGAARANGQGPALSLAQCPLALMAGLSAQLRLSGPPTPRTADAGRRLSRTLAEPRWAPGRPVPFLLPDREQKRDRSAWLSQVKQARDVLRVF